MDGISTPCQIALSAMSAGAAVQCPDNSCFIYDWQHGKYQQFFAGAGGAEGYLSPSEAGQMHEWDGQFLTDRDYYKVQRSDPAYGQQFDLNVRKIIAVASRQGHQYSYDQVKSWINQAGYSEDGAPVMGGGNWNFRFAGDAPDYLQGLASPAKNRRVTGWESLHLHPDSNFHVDTASGGWLWFVHGFVDVFLGNTIYAKTGIPR